MKTGTTNSGVTADQFEAALAKYSIAESREILISRMIEEKMDEITGQYRPELDAIVHVKHVAFDIVQSYCLDNKSKLFSKRRSIGTMYGKAGFRLGTPKLKTRKGSNWQQVLGSLKEKLPEYVRTTEEPARDLLIADRHKSHVAPILADIGLEIVQEELFYIDTRKETRKAA